MFFSWLKSGLLVLPLIVAGCGPVPKAFQQTKAVKASTDLARPDQSRSLMISVPLLEPAKSGDYLAVSLLEAFERAGIPATLNVNRDDAPLLAGDIWSVDDTTGLMWELFGDDGEFRTMVVTDSVPPAPERDSADAEALEKIVNIVVAELLPRLRPTVGSITPASDPAVYVGAVTGAPGDGDVALVRAVIAALDRAGVRRVDDLTAARLILEAAVKVVGIDGETDAVRIRWTMEDAGGEAIGRLTQRNLVAAGALRERWGLAAFDAAEAIVAPVADTLQSLRTVPPESGS